MYERLKNREGIKFAFDLNSPLQISEFIPQSCNETAFDMIRLTDRLHVDPQYLLFGDKHFPGPVFGTCAVFYKLDFLQNFVR